MRNFDWRSLIRCETGSVLMIIFGVLLTFKPDSASGMVSAVLGWGLIVMGVTLMVRGFVEKLGPVPIGIGAAALLAGNWFHRHPLIIASVIGIVLGILVLSQGLREGRSALLARQSGDGWIFGGVLAVLEILLGIRLIFSPLLVSRFVLRICGILMAVCGVCNLTAFGRSRMHTNGSRIIDAE